MPCAMRDDTIATHVGGPPGVCLAFSELTMLGRRHISFMRCTHNADIRASYVHIYIVSMLI